MVNLIELISGNIYLGILTKTVVILTAALILHVIVKTSFSKISKKVSEEASVEEKKLKQTRINFLQILFAFLIYLFACIFILFLIPGFKAFSVSLLAGAGILAIVVGLAAQKTLANIISGISIAVSVPFRIGDRIKVGEEYGDVEELTLRHTVMKTWDNRRVIIPNALVADKEIVNYSIKDEKMMWTVNIGIGYDSDIDKARKIMLDKAKKHPEVIVPDVANSDGEIEKGEPYVMVTECGDFSVKLRLYFWVSAPNKTWQTSFELIEQIKKEFDKQGIDMPFLQRTITRKKSLRKGKKK